MRDVDYFSFFSQTDSFILYVELSLVFQHDCFVDFGWIINLSRLFSEGLSGCIFWGVICA